MDIRQMEYINTICETGSLSSATKKLYVSQQALSKAMDRLERELGLQLFVRGRRGVEMTREGQIFLNEIQYVIRSNDRMLSRMNVLRKEYSDLLRIMFFSGFPMQLPKGYLETFIMNHPNVRFEIQSYLDNTQAREKLSMDVDLFFATCPVKLLGMELIYEFHTPLNLFVSEDHVLAKRKRVKLAELREFSVLSINSDFDAQRRVEKLLNQNGVYIQYKLGDGEVPLMQWLVKEQKVVSFFAGRKADMIEGTVMLEIEDADLTWSMYIGSVCLFS